MKLDAVLHPTISFLGARHVISVFFLSPLHWESVYLFISQGMLRPDCPQT